MNASSIRAGPERQSIAAVIQKYWGFDELRPLQREAIESAIERRDSLVVMPTGGGKSLCYQVPPIVANRTDIVVSPLISLMKDQVDALRACGYPAAALHSGLSEQERSEISAGASAGKYRLLFVAPERLLTPAFLSLIQRLDIQAFAIDEAHCISQWGHDFRPEYRQLALLKQRFPGASLHAYTATATPRVREDIITQLGLEKPALLIGRFDRPNLTYRVVPSFNLQDQLLDIVRRHKDSAVIVYCLSRNDAERLAEALGAKGIKAAPYHAGLSPLVRTRTQEAFAAEKIDVVVATVAFGMGIDRSNVRCVVHAAMPKSIEHYQQETGRAGRDGLEAECVLLFSAADVRRWEFLISKSGSETSQPSETTAAQLELLRQMQRFCSSTECRHAALSRYFGQSYESEDCGACDICAAGAAPIEDATLIAHQVISCIKSLGASFGVGYVVDVLLGSRNKKIQQRAHYGLPEYGALKQLSKEALQDAVHQLVGQDLLIRTEGDRPVLKLSRTSREVLAGQREVKLRATSLATAALNDKPGWQETDRGLFDHLRDLRRSIAADRGVPPFVIFADTTLRDLASLRPSSLASFRRLRGVGEKKLADFGERFVAAIASYCDEQQLTTDVFTRPPEAVPAGTARPSSGTRAQAFALFGQGASLDEVEKATGRARSTVAGYLEEYIVENKPPSIAAWVTPLSHRTIEAAARKVGGSFLRPVFEELGGESSYDEIRLVMRHAGLR